MAQKRSGKRARKEDGILGNAVKEDNGDCCHRKGVAWRADANKWVVEMRPPNWKWKLNFGSYKTEAEAMVARDYGAFLRASAGENVADAGGFGTDHKLYQYEESRAIFESMEETMVRRREVVPLYRQLIKEKWDGHGLPPHHEFCKAARKDILLAIEKFHKSYRHRLEVTSPPTETEKDVPQVEPVHGGIHCTSSSSNPEVGVSPKPTPGRRSGAIKGDAASTWNFCSDMPVQIAVAVNGSPFLKLLDMQVLFLDEEQVFRIVNGLIGRIKEELDKSSFDKFLEESEPCDEEELDKSSLDKFLEELEPCDVDPVSIPAIEVPQSKA